MPNYKYRKRNGKANTIYAANKCRRNMVIQIIIIASHTFKLLIFHANGYQFVVSIVSVFLLLIMLIIFADVCFVFIFSFDVAYARFAFLPVFCVLEYLIRLAIHNSQFELHKSIAVWFGVLKSTDNRIVCCVPYFLFIYYINLSYCL